MLKLNFICLILNIYLGKYYMTQAYLTGPIIFGLLIGTLYRIIGPKSKGNINMSLKDIVENDPELKSIDKNNITYG